MTQILRRTALAAVVALALPGLAAAQTTTGIPPAITTPDKVETRIGTLEFKPCFDVQRLVDARR